MLSKLTVKATVGGAGVDIAQGMVRSLFANPTDVFATYAPGGGQVSIDVSGGNLAPNPLRRRSTRSSSSRECQLPTSPRRSRHL